MYPPNQPPPRPVSLSHPNLATLVGLALLALLVPVVIAYDLTGFALALVGAGVVAAIVARGGGSMGFGAGARAGAIFMLLLLTAWALVEFQGADPSGVLASPWIEPFLPYIVGMASLWDSLLALTQPILGGFAALVGGGLFVDLILQIVFPAVLAGAGGVLGGIIAGKPTMEPMPAGGLPQAGAYPQGYAQAYPQAYPETYSNNPHAGGSAYLCPWCGLKVLPHMEMCWNCGGPLQLPPPPAQG